MTVRCSFPGCTRKAVTVFPQAPTWGRMICAKCADTVAAGLLDGSAAGVKAAFEWAHQWTKTSQ